LAASGLRRASAHRLMEHASTISTRASPRVSGQGFARCPLRGEPRKAPHCFGRRSRRGAKAVCYGDVGTPSTAMVMPNAPGGPDYRNRPLRRRDDLRRPRQCSFSKFSCVGHPHILADTRASDPARRDGRRRPHQTCGTHLGGQCRLPATLLHHHATARLFDDRMIVSVSSGRSVAQVDDLGADVLAFRVFLGGLDDNSSHHHATMVTCSPAARSVPCRSAPDSPSFSARKGVAIKNFVSRNHRIGVGMADLSRPLASAAVNGAITVRPGTCATHE